MKGIPLQPPLHPHVVRGQTLDIPRAGLAPGALGRKVHLAGPYHPPGCGVRGGEKHLSMELMSSSAAWLCRGAPVMLDAPLLLDSE